MHTLDLSLSVLRCVAVRCSVLPCGAVCCSALQCVVWVTYIQTASAKSIKRNLRKRICYFCRARCHKKPDVLSSLHIGAPYTCMCEYTHTHTHTYCTWMTESDVSPGVGTRHIESPKNQDGLNLRINLSVRVYEVHMYTYLPGNGVRSWISCFFSWKMRFFRNAAAKNVNVIPRTQIHMDLSYIDPPSGVLNYFLK